MQKVVGSNPIIRSSQAPPSAGFSRIVSTVADAGTDKIDALRSVPIFAGLPSESLERIAELASEVEFPPNQVVIEARTPGAGMFVILDGRVSVHARGVDTELGPGEVIGEVSLLRSDNQRIARVQTLTDVRCLAVDRASFRELVAEDGRLALALLENVAQRIPI
jgi:CRP-like cAMP-binding protein